MDGEVCSTSFTLTCSGLSCARAAFSPPKAGGAQEGEQELTATANKMNFHCRISRKYNLSTHGSSTAGAASFSPARERRKRFSQRRTRGTAQELSWLYAADWAPPITTHQQQKCFCCRSWISRSIHATFAKNTPRISTVSLLCWQTRKGSPLSITNGIPLRVTAQRDSQPLRALLMEPGPHPLAVLTHGAPRKRWTI